MRTITPNMKIEIPSAEVLAQAMLDRIAERERVRQVAAELTPRVERALGLERPVAGR
jgi:hypothetical protein